MKLKFKHQKFQADAAKSVVDVFAGQPYNRHSYLGKEGLMIVDATANAEIILSDAQILENLQKVQRRNHLEPSKNLEKTDETFNLTIEMETGVGKTYTYIKTMYELNKNFGWSKFIIVVPSIAIREGVYKTFQVTAEHFAEEYGAKVRFFIYNSARLSELNNFATDSAINAMIINAQAFNSRGENARRILMELDEFGNQIPLETIAATNPILIIDEPQSVEGARTKEGLRDFKPLLTLRYSATHRADSVYNMIYRLDALDAYEKRLVKKIQVIGIKASSNAATAGFVYLERINLFKDKPPTATITFDCRGANGIRQITRTVKEGFNLYEKSGGLDEYADKFIVDNISGIDDSLIFLNGTKIFVGEVIGKVDAEKIQRTQISETIKIHLRKESELFRDGIKVLSLFFIDEVKHYRIYDEEGNATGGDFAKWFEEEYSAAVEEILKGNISDAYRKYLLAITADRTHAGYFSIDKKGRMTDSAIKDKREKTSDDTDAYNLIMKNKELLLDLDAVKSPVRFIFSHSALREGWDNPNVFQICTLKSSGSEIRKRQEVGRGLRLCVNQIGERMDESILGAEVHKKNILTVIAGESYEDFTRKLQTEIADAVSYRPRKVDKNLFLKKFFPDDAAKDVELAESVIYELITNKYIDRKGFLTDKYFDDKKSGSLQFTPEIADCAEKIVEILDTVYNKNVPPIEKENRSKVTATVSKDKLAMPEFKALWEKIHAKTYYEVIFDERELIKKSVADLNEKIHVAKIYLNIERGEYKENITQENLIERTAFDRTGNDTIAKISADSAIKYDVIGRLVEETGLTRKNIVEILRGVDAEIFAQLANNPEEFITKAGKILNGVKAVTVIDHIQYHLAQKTYDTNIFTDAQLEGIENVNALRVNKNLYDYVIYDSEVEKNFVEKLDGYEKVVVYVKLPSGFFITTPLGKYTPDWAIAFREGEVKHIYFVAETKGSVESAELKNIEKAKTDCAKKHFKLISNEEVFYSIVKDYKGLTDLLNDKP